MDKEDDSVLALSEKERDTLGFLIDLEDRGSEWPYAQRIVNAIGITIPGGELLLARLADRGFVHIHPNLNEATTQYAITPAGRVRYFEEVRGRK